MPTACEEVYVYTRSPSPEAFDSNLGVSSHAVQEVNWAMMLLDYDDLPAPVLNLTCLHSN